MFKPLYSALVLTLAAGAFGEIIPPSRRIVWDPGVPGGIPSRSTIFADVTQSPYGADKTGVADASAKIQAAINACPNGQIVYIPAGTYRLNGQLTIAKGIVLRGAGPNRTFLKSYAEWHCIQIGDFPSTPVATSVVGGLTKDSTSLVVSSVTNPALTVGDYIVIDQKNDGVEVVNVDDESRDNNSRSLSQITKITNISGSGPYTLGISPSLHHPYASAQSPEIWKLNQGSSMTINAGLEDLCVERVSPIAQNGYSNIKLVSCAYSWVRNIESKMAIFRHVDLDRSFRCEVRDSYFNDGYYQGTGGYSYGVVCGNRSTDNLVENNVFRHLRHSMVVHGGATGCVYGYNYSFDTYQGDAWLAPDMFVHGAHATMNLFEGNYGTKMDSDFTHGSGSYNTFFRNYATTVSNAVAISGGRWAVNMDVTQSYANFVGNVLGRTNLTWTSEETGATRNTSATYIWSWGFRGDGDTTRDTTFPQDSTLRHGNYSSRAQAASWDPAITDSVLPASLYLATRPVFFITGLLWPSIGPDVTQLVVALPAKVRYDAGFPPELLAPSNLKVTIDTP